jgi:hypothetical protein
MLDFHPDRRITIDKALQHPFLLSLHNSDDEPVADFTFSFDFENDDLSREQVQDLIWEEIRELHAYIPDAPPNSSQPRVRANKMLDSRADSKNEGSEVDSTLTRKRSISQNGDKAQTK